ncbi:hypothetical protein SpCBS45565_g07103 [Spizellomyces sp. 'palustris']|nr:hypothetical protein SpCBS45565_g07103 [Spizellomyces sp. 'palustris']
MYSRMVSHRQATSPASSPSDKHDPDYYINIGTATRILRDDLPNFMEQGLTTFDIYSKEVAFTEPYHLKFCCRGRRWYKVLAGSTRTLLRMYFAEGELNIIKMQQMRGPERGAGDETLDAESEQSELDLDGSGARLVVRWIFEGTPRHQLIANNMDILATPRSVYEGVFVYVFDDEGLIKEHRLEAIHPSPPLFSGYRWWKGYRAPVEPNLSVRAEAVQIPVRQGRRVGDDKG